jgi:hypothetical protein
VDRYPASPVSLAELSLDGVPQHLYAGTTIRDTQLAVIRSLIEHDVLPALTPEANESTSGFVERSFTALGTKWPHIPFEATLVVDSESEGHYGYDDLGPIGKSADETGNAFLALRAQDARFYIDIEGFDRRMSTIDPALCGNLVENLCLASFGIFNTMSPRHVFEIAEMEHFNGEYSEWWLNIAEEIANERERCEYKSVTDRPVNTRKPEKREVAPVTNAEIRKYIRDNHIATPGKIRRILGRHYVKYHRLSDRAIVQRIQQLPPKLRTACKTIHSATKAIAKISRRIDEATTENAIDIAQEFECDREPVVFLDPQGSLGENSTESLLVELVDEHYQIMSQSGAPAPNIIIELQPTKTSARNLVTILDCLQAASDLIRQCENAFQSIKV